PASRMCGRSACPCFAPANDLGQLTTEGLPLELSGSISFAAYRPPQFADTLDLTGVCELEGPFQGSLCSIHSGILRYRAICIHLRCPGDIEPQSGVRGTQERTPPLRRKFRKACRAAPALPQAREASDTNRPERAPA